MHFNTLDKVSISTLCSVFNTAFADYAIPFQLTADSLSAKINAEHIDLSLSVGAFDNDHLAGFILFGIDDVNGVRTAWDGGTGVIPECRGQKLTQRMFEYARPLLQQAGVKKVLLEVLETNTTAYNIYEQIRFKKTRMLHAYQGQPSIKKNKAYAIEVVSTYDADHLLNMGNWQPAWQQMNNRVKGWSNDITTIVIQDKSKICAYAHYSPKRGRVFQFAVDSAHRRQGMATAIFDYMYDSYTPLSIVNVDEVSSDAVAFIKAIGIEFYMSQYEMAINW